jgi:probable O-glycosylation ligase (exosortase A-associated)
MKGLIFTYGLTYGGAVLSLFNPQIGLLVYICFAIIRPEHMWYWSVPQGNYSRIVAGGLLLGWFIGGMGKWSFGRAQGVVLALIGYWAVTVLSATWASHPEAAWRAVEILTKIVLPFLVGITTLDSVKKIKQLTWVILLSQAYVAFELNLNYFDGYNRLLEEGFGGMDNNCNAIAFVSCIGLAFFLGLETTNRWLQMVALAAAAFMAHGILLSFSRGGMLALVITGIVSFLLLPKRPMHYLLFGIALLVVLRLAGPEVQARFGTAFAAEGARDASAESRVQLWQVCWDLMLRYPAGVGADQFGFMVGEYGFPVGKLAHSLWLQVGAETGFVGLGSLAMFYLLCIVRLWPLATDRSGETDPWLNVAARMVVASLVGFAVSAQFVSLINLEVPYYIALIGAGVLKLSSEPLPLVVSEEASVGAEQEEFAPEWVEQFG